jgi:purine-binding chemotaxis protein CheW
VPVIDMRLRRKLGTPTYNAFTIGIVLNIRGRVIGMVVDSVSDVTTLSPAQIRPAPGMGRVMNTDYLIGLGMLEGRMLMLIDIDKLMASDEMFLAERLAA